MSRIAILCPGRGSYTKRARKALPRDNDLVRRADELRAEYGLPSLIELDYADRWRSAIQLRPDNVSPLIYVVSMIDAAEAMAEHETVCVGGNSMGWYTALAVAGALSFDDGFRLVQEMALLQMEHTDGGQVIYPLIGDQWRIEPTQVERVDAALAASAEVFPSIALGGYAVLAGTEAGVEHLLDHLPGVEMGPSVFPYRLAQHGPYHTPLLEDVARKAQRTLGDRLAFRAPRVTLIDGHGRQYAPWTTDPAALAAYTLGRQITTPFGFTTTVRVALREHAPERLALPGPGNTLGGVCGQIAIMEGYRGLASRHAFEEIQESETPVVWSMRR